MFLAFLLRGVSLPAHKFLRGLLFVYGMQLHQLTLNSILHIACFSLFVSIFLELVHTGSFGNSFFAFAPASLWTKS
jgi:hypothetical protein